MCFVYFLNNKITIFTTPAFAVEYHVRRRTSNAQIIVYIT